MTSDYLNTLLAELDVWAKANLTATFWWRDDDAAEPCVSLDKLFALSDRQGVPCGLATIPAKSGEPLRKAVSGAGHIWVIQHGYAHINHANKGEGAWELGLHRPTSVILDELRDGMVKLSQLYKDRFVPALVPPWNRIDPELLPYLPVMGFRGLSASYKSHRPVPPGDLRVADAHCDLLTWKGPDKTARFAGADQCVERIVSHLTDKRMGKADDTEPTCVLSHHLEMDSEAWDFLDLLLSFTRTHPAVNWMSPADIWSA